MQAIVFHRGNTFEAMENSREAINTTINVLSGGQWLAQQIQDIKKHIVLELDIIAKYPFIVYHNTEDMANLVFDTDKNEINIANKKIWELTDVEISKCYYKNTKSKPLILEELLELAKSNNVMLYLDIKVPEYTYTWQQIRQYINIPGEIYRMCDIIVKYIDAKIIDCVISFSLLATLLIKLYIDGNKLKNKLILGMFCCEYYPDSNINMLYNKFINYIVQPTVYSYELSLLDKQIQYRKTISSNGADVKYYVWTIHKNDLVNRSTFLSEHNLIPVVDMFDI
jgi:glycerophosphoryl diester phosphodiesterase